MANRHPRHGSLIARRRDALEKANRRQDFYREVPYNADHGDFARAVFVADRHAFLVVRHLRVAGVSDDPDIAARICHAQSAFLGRRYPGAPERSERAIWTLREGLSYHAVLDLNARKLGSQDVEGGRESINQARLLSCAHRLRENNRRSARTSAQANPGARRTRMGQARGGPWSCFQ